MAGDSRSIGGVWFNRNGDHPLEYIFIFAGILLWFAVGVMWKDRAIMVVHIGAFISLLGGYLSAA